MKLDQISQEQIEKFLAQYTGQPQLHLPRIQLHSGWLANKFTACIKASAITFAHHLFLSREYSVRLKATAPAIEKMGSLLVHEAVHVWQYQQQGLVRFLAIYALYYLVMLMKMGSLGAEARYQAYLNIPYEIQARKFEQLFIKKQCKNSFRK